MTALIGHGRDNCKRENDVAGLTCSKSGAGATRRPPLPRQRAFASRSPGSGANGAGEARGAARGRMLPTTAGSGGWAARPPYSRPVPRPVAGGGDCCRRRRAGVGARPSGRASRSWRQWGRAPGVRLPPWRPSSGQGGEPPCGGGAAERPRAAGLPRAGTETVRRRGEGAGTVPAGPPLAPTGLNSRRPSAAYSRRRRPGRPRDCPVYSLVPQWGERGREPPGLTESSQPPPRARRRG